MECQRILQDLSLFLDRELAPRRDRELRAHLQRCPGCRATLQELERNRDILAALPRVALPPAIFGRVVAEVSRAAPRTRLLVPPLPRRHLGRRVLAAAAVILVLCLTALTVLGYYSEEPGLDVAGQPLVNRHALDSGAPLMGEPPLWVPASYVPGEVETWP